MQWPITTVTLRALARFLSLGIDINTLICRGKGEGLAPSLYEVLGTHQHSKNHEIRGQYWRNLHVLEFVKRVDFSQKISRF